MAYIGRPPANAALTSADIADGIITNTDIAADAAIEQTKLATLTIDTANIADDAITAAKINDGEIVNAAVSSTAAIDDTKISPPYYAAVANFPAASDHHGRIVHAHSEGAMYYSHGGSWVQLADNSGIPTNTSDLTNDSSFAVLSADQTFTAANRGTITAVTPAASVTFDLTTTNNFSLTLISTSADPTLNFPTLTSAMVGQSGNIYLDNVSGGTPKTISKAANILMTTASFNALSTTAGKYWLSYYVVDTTNVLVTASAVLA